LGNLATPENIQKLQTALHAKAKGEPGFRFYSLYDKVHRRDVLEYAYACCRANQGAAGVDGERFEDVEVYGVERWLGELADTLRKKTYRPQALRRVYVPKPNGKLRSLSIPTIRDRTAMMAATLILAPIVGTRNKPGGAFHIGRSNEPAFSRNPGNHSRKKFASWPSRTAQRT
jgi:RNA-directed DNA polymerase